MANGDINPLVKILLQVGVPSAIAVYLVYILAGGMQHSLQDTEMLLQQHTAQSVLMEKRLDEQAVAFEVLVQIQKANCLHQAHGASERNECYQASKR